MPLVDLDDPDDLRARWSALAAVAHATGYDRRWWADEIGWHHEDPAGNDLRMVVLDDDRAVLFGYHVEYSQTAGQGGTDLLGGAPEWIAQPEVRHRLGTGGIGFVYGQFSGTWARAGYPGDPWQPIDDGFMAVGSWLTSDEETAAELVEWAAEWADFLGSTDQLMSAGLQLVHAAGTTGISSDHLLDVFDLLGIGPGSPRHPDLAAALHAAAAFGGPIAAPPPVQTAQPADDRDGGDAFARLGLMDFEPEDAGYADEPYPSPSAYADQPPPERYAEPYADPGYYLPPDGYTDQPALEPSPEPYAGPRIEDYNDLFADSVQHPDQPPPEGSPVQPPPGVRPEAERLPSRRPQPADATLDTPTPEIGSEREPVPSDDRAPAAPWRPEPGPFSAPRPAPESEPPAERRPVQSEPPVTQPRPAAEPQPAAKTSEPQPAARAVPDEPSPSAAPAASAPAAEPAPPPTTPGSTAPASDAPAGSPDQSSPRSETPGLPTRASQPSAPDATSPAPPPPSAPASTESTAPGSTAPGSTAPGSTAPGSTAPGSTAPGSVPAGGGTPPLGVPAPAPPMAAKANGVPGDGRTPRRRGRGPAGVPEQRPEPQPASKLVFPSFLPPVVEEPPAAPAGSLEAAMRAEPERPRPRPARTDAEELLHKWCLARTRVVPSGFTIQIQALDPATLAFSFDLQPPPVPGMDRITGLLRDLWQADAHTERGGWLFARIDAAGRTLRIDRWYDQIPPWWEHDLDDSVDVPGLLRRLSDRAPQWRPSYLNRLPADAR